MMSFFRRHRQGLFLAIVAIFLIGTFVGLGSYLFTGADTSETVAIVDGRKIPYLQFRLRVNQYLDALRERKTLVTEQMESQVKQEMLRDMIVEQLLAIQAEKMGLKISDTELSLSIQGTPAFQRDGHFDQLLYFHAVRQAFQMTPEEYERAQKKALLAQKLKSIIFSSAKLLPGEFEEAYARAPKLTAKDLQSAKKQGFKGTLKELDEQRRQAILEKLHRERALDAINFYLHQLAAQVDIRSFLEAREGGA